MAGNKDDPGAGASRPADPPVAKRPYATIDVKATEVGGAGTAQSSAAAKASAASARSAAAPGRADGSEARPPKVAARLAALWQRVGAAAFLTHLAAGVGGGLLAVIAALALSSREPPPEHGALAARIVAIEAALQQAEPATLSANLQRLSRAVATLEETQASLARENKALATRIGAAGDVPPELSQRLAKLEEGLAAAVGEAGQSRNGASANGALAARLADLEKSVRQTRDTVTTAIARIDLALANGRSDAVRLAERLGSLQQETERQLKGAARAVDLTPLGVKLTAMEQELHAIVGSEADRATNVSRLILGLELGNLKRAVDRGEDYSAELAQLQKTAGNTLNLATLERYMAEGAPRVEELATSFSQTANAMIDAEQVPSDATLFERLLAGARSIVRVRKIGHASGDNSTEAVIDRVQSALRQGRLADALGHAKALPPKAAAAGEGWINKANARLAVDQALADLENTLKASLTGRAAGDARR
jgi:hypothetical protein